MLKRQIENKLFKISKNKTDIIGYWKDNSGKLYKDYIVLYNPLHCYDLRNQINNLFKSGEKAVFFRSSKESFIFYPDKAEDILKENIQLIYNKGYLKPSIFKKLLRDYNGFTVFKTNEYYLVDIWQA